MFLDNESIIIRPILTEKSNLERVNKKKFYFEVHASATKHTIKCSLERLFNVKVNKCWVVNIKGKKLKTRKQLVFFKKNKKKAIVSLKKESPIFSFYDSF